MNDLENFTNAIIDININDELIIDKYIFFNNIKNIIKKYSYNNDEKEKLYKMANYIVKIKNDKLKRLKEKYDFKDIDDLIFFNLKLIESKKIDYFCCLYIRYLNNNLKFNDLKKFINVIVRMDMDKFEFIWFIDYEDKKCTNNEYGERLCKNGLAKKCFKLGDVEYQLNEDGKKFFNNIYLDPTVKEKEIYSNEIDLNKISTLDSVINHKRYYDEVMERIENDDNRIKVARLHDKSYKDFFEEYDVLIKYAIAEYGDKCKIKFCGKDTSNTIKYDGIVKVGEKEERIEITSPFHDEEEKLQMKQLNRVGISNSRNLNYNCFEENIVSTIEDILEKKNGMDSYDNSINLVIMFDDFEYIFSDQIANEKYINSLFEKLKYNKYKFKSVSILIDRYCGDKIELEPRIIKIK